MINLFDKPVLIGLDKLLYVVGSHSDWCYFFIGQEGPD